MVATNISNHSFKLLVLAYDYMLTPNNRVKNQWNNTQNKLETELRSLKYNNFDELEVLSQSAKRQMELLQTVNSSQRTTSVTPVALISSLHQLNNSSLTVSKSLRNTMTKHFNKMYFTLLFVTLTLIILLAALAILIITKISNPINVLGKKLEKVGQGNLASQIEINGFLEISQLGNSANIMRENLQRTTVSKNALAIEVEQRRKTDEQNFKLIEKLNETQAQVVSMEKQSTIGTLVGGVAHEINNPVMAILGYMDFISTLNTNEKIADKIAKTERLLGRIQRITQGLLVFSRNKKKGIHNCDINATIDRVVELFNSSINGSSIDFKYQNLSNGVKVFIEEDHLEQVVLNLLLNAAQAIETQPSPQITLLIIQVGDICRITITDNGPGIPDDIKFKIFDPFFTTKPVGKGTGLGLSISNTLITNAQGRLTVESIQGVETTFTIELNCLQLTNKE
ncbi:ATP-binding protein [Shewanella maritima]|nr:ATP-binding protein [Shewanella maritima]